MCRDFCRSLGTTLLILVLVAVSRGSPGEDKKREMEAHELFEKGFIAEKKKDYPTAIRFYRQAQALFPETPQLHYRVGVCLQGQGEKSEAVKALKTFLAIGSKAKDLVADAIKRLDDLLLPKLTPEQRNRWEEAEDKLEALEAQAELAGRAIEGEVVDQTPAKDAVKILVALYTQVPEYLPLHSKLASAYEHLKEYQKAFESYDSYIKGYEKLGYPPADLRTIRVRRDACASSARAITIAGKRTYLKDHGTCEILGPLTKGQQQRGLSRFITVSFEGDVLVLTAQTGTDSESDKILSGDLKEIYRVDPKAIDPSTIRYVNISQPEFSRDAFTIYADTVGGEKEVKCEFWRRRAAKDPPVTIHEDRNLFFMQAPDEKTAQGLVNALRELVTLNSR